MIREYLKSLKTKGEYSWSDISKLSGMPEVTIRKIFSGETADPRFETVVRLVSAMGGSLDKVNAIEKIEEIEIDDDSQMRALIAIKEVYEERIKDIKASSLEHLQSLKRDKQILIFVSCALAVLLVGALIFDIFMGSIGWLRW